MGGVIGAGILALLNPHQRHLLRLVPLGRKAVARFSSCHLAPYFHLPATSKAAMDGDFGRIRSFTAGDTVGRPMYYPLPAANTQRLKEFATELLENIFSHLSKQDLTHVVRVCKSFALSGRLLLYRHIDLRSDDPHVEHTLQLLRGERTIGAKILSAVVTTRRPTLTRRRRLGLKSWIAPDFVEYWTKLRVLEMRGFPFSDDVEDAAVFLDTLRRCCPRLRHFSFKPGSGALPDNFALSGLRGIEWQNELMTIEMPIIPMMAASEATLTNISFTGTVIHMRGKPYDRFLHDLRFPFLRTLELGSLTHSNSEIRTNMTITSFILAHPTIENLSLGRTRPSYFFFQFNEREIKPESLPALKTFEGFPENITLLASRSVQSFFYIKSLSICCADNDVNLRSKFQEMLTAITHAEGTPKKFVNVVYLRCEFYAQLSHRMALNTISLTNLHWVDQLSHVCPAVVEWYGRLPPMDSNHLMNMFRMYEHLEVISLPRLSLFVHMAPSELEYFRPVSGRCSRLRKVIARRPEYTELDDVVFILERDEHGTLESVTVTTSHTPIKSNLL